VVETIIQRVSCEVWSTGRAIDFKMKKENKQEGKVSVETLYHFQCGNVNCKKWWAVGDAPLKKLVWYCTWCGKEQEIDIKNYSHYE